MLPPAVVIYHCSAASGPHILYLKLLLLRSQRSLNTASVHSESVILIALACTQSSCGDRLGSHPLQAKHKRKNQDVPFQSTRDQHLHSASHVQITCTGQMHTYTTQCRTENPTPVLEEAVGTVPNRLWDITAESGRISKSALCQATAVDLSVESLGDCCSCTISMGPGELLRWWCSGDVRVGVRGS